MSRRQNEAASMRRPADPGAAAQRQLVDLDDADATPGSKPTPQSHFAPVTGEVCLRSTPPPDRGEEKEAGESQAIKKMQT
jgi:hypothetical protein